MLNKEHGVGLRGSQWEGCYDSGWGNEIVAEAYAHP